MNQHPGCRHGRQSSGRAARLGGSPVVATPSFPGSSPWIPKLLPRRPRRGGPPSLRCPIRPATRRSQGPGIDCRPFTAPPRRGRRGNHFRSASPHIGPASKSQPAREAPGPARAHWPAGQAPRHTPPIHRGQRFFGTARFPIRGGNRRHFHARSCCHGGLAVAVRRAYGAQSGPPQGAAKAPESSAAHSPSRHGEAAGSWPRMARHRTRQASARGGLLGGCVPPAKSRRANSRWDPGQEMARHRTRQASARGGIFGGCVPPAKSRRANGRWNPGQEWFGTGPWGCGACGRGQALAAAWAASRRRCLRFCQRRARYRSAAAVARAESHAKALPVRA